MSKNSVNKLSNKQVAITVGVVILVSALAVAGYIYSQQKNAVNSFSQCKDAGGVILQTFPEQCSLNDKTYTDGVSGIDTAGSTSTSAYIGLSEADALAKAKQANKPARVVERDGEPLPVPPTNARLFMIPTSPS